LNVFNWLELAVDELIVGAIDSEAAAKLGLSSS